VKAARRGPANFTVSGYSAAFKRDVVWKITVTESGVSAKRTEDGRDLSIDWRTLLGSAMFYGCDSLRGDNAGKAKL